MVITDGKRRLAILEVAEAGLTGDWLRPIERSFTAAGVPGISGAGSTLRLVGKTLNKAGLLRHLVDLSTKTTIVQLPDLAAYRAFPHILWGEIIPDCFDCWEPVYPQWEDLLKRLSPKIAFFSARQSARHMKNAIPGLDAIWSPEAIDPTDYRPHKPLTDRTIDILEMGRKNDAYHSTITPHCETMGYSHRFEKIKGSIIFPSRRDLLDGLGDTKISVCFPSSITHPDRSGGVETLTQRYLEAIASGNIILGRCPAELSDLFGFNPVVEIDPSDPLEQIDHILSRIEDYADLTRRSLARLHEVGTLKKRAERMLSILKDRHFDI